MIIANVAHATASSPKKVSQTNSSLCNSVAFNTIKFRGAHNPFPKDYSGDYTSIINHPSLKKSNYKETSMLNALLMECVDSEKHVKT